MGDHIEWLAVKVCIEAFLIFLELAIISEVLETDFGIDDDLNQRPELIDVEKLASKQEEYRIVSSVFRKSEIFFSNCL